MTLTQFLLARIAEDEAVAKAVTQSDYSEGRWDWEFHRLPPYRSALVNDRGVVILPPKHDDVYPSAAVAEHIARHDPARVLAECEAKRRIVEQVAPLVDYDRDKFIVMRSVETSAASTLRHLAAVYADHPDYDEEWAV